MSSTLKRLTSISCASEAFSDSGLNAAPPERIPTLPDMYGPECDSCQLRAISPACSAFNSPATSITPPGFDALPKYDAAYVSEACAIPTDIRQAPIGLKP